MKSETFATNSGLPVGKKSIKVIDNKLITVVTKPTINPPVMAKKVIVGKYIRKGLNCGIYSKATAASKPVAILIPT